MTTVATWLIVATALVAVADWVAVARGMRGVEYLCKPLVMFVLIAAALALDPVDPAERRWFVAALACSLVGDVFLMLEDQQRWFVPGLAAFLLGHVGYVVGMIVAGLDGGAVAVGAGVVVSTVTTSTCTRSSVSVSHYHSVARIVRDIGAQCGQEALRVVNMMNESNIKWTPGKQRGRSVRVQFNLPVRFKLE